MNPLSNNSDKKIAGLPQQPQQPQQEKAEALAGRPNMKTGSIPDPDVEQTSSQAQAGEKLPLEKSSTDPAVSKRSSSNEANNEEAEKFFEDLRLLFGAPQATDKKIDEALIASKSQYLKIPQSMASVPFISMAIYQGCSTQCIENLIKMGANPDVPDQNLETALRHATRGQWSVKGGDVEMVKLLLSCGAKINDAVPTSSPCSLLGFAAISGNSEIVRLLLAYGADREHIQNNGKTALECAVLFENFDVIKLLGEDVAKLEKSTRSSPSFLGDMLEKQKVEMVQFLVEHGARLDHPNYLDRLRGMLINAIQTNNYAFVKAVLARTGVGTELTKELLSGGPAGSTSVLTYAVLSGNELMVAELLLYRVDTAYTDSRAYSALMVACELGHAKIVEQLLKAAKGNFILNSANKDQYGHTAIGLAVRSGHADVLRVLLRNAQQDIKSVIRDKQGNIDLLGLACLCRNPEVLKVLIEFGLPVNYAIPDSNISLLTILINFRNTPAIRMLLERGADVNLRDAFGGTALMVATHHLDLEVVELLLANGAKQLPDNNGNTPLDLIAQMRPNDQQSSRRLMQVRELLLQAGRKVQRDDEGKGM